MAKYPRPRSQGVVEEPKAAARHYWHVLLHGVVKHRDNLLIAALVVAVVFLGSVVWSRYRQSQATQAWAALGLAQSPADLESAAYRYANTPAGIFLKMQLADQFIRTDEAAKGVELYRQVVDKADGEEKLIATYGLATAEEAAGDFDGAKRTLEGLSNASGFWGEKARAALTGLDGRKQAYEQLEALKAQAAKEAAERARAATAESTAAQPAAPGMESSQALTIAPLGGSIAPEPATAPGTTENQ